MGVRDDDKPEYTGATINQLQVNAFNPPPQFPQATPVPERPVRNAGLGATLAVGAAIFFYSALAPWSVSKTMTAKGSVDGGALLAATKLDQKRIETNEAQQNEAGALENRKGTVNGLIEKGKARSSQTRDEYFDKLEELFPGEAKQIRAARKESLVEDNAESTGKGDESGGGSSEDGVKSRGSDEPDSASSDSTSSGSTGSTGVDSEAGATVGTAEGDASGGSTSEGEKVDGASTVLGKDGRE